ncbi:heme utilization protein [Pseudomonas sp. UL073]|uniref:Heme utilization protein n=1 Tax=Zestomonas insulae TaxID=2809017 RepID=A0ABS2IGD1_9GAMM|nr:heme utilization protein [Pseudomonas insulae]MBM7061997.1 heme utilization protein [Pseudomonas insulae]
MKCQMILKPVVVAMALALSAGAYATGGGASASGSTAEVKDVQTNKNNEVTNHETKNTATVGGGGVDVQTNGNAGVNVVAGDNNQQANAAAIATADSLFVFGQSFGGSANATIEVTQKGQDNYVENIGTQNNASVDADLTASGNLGLNAAAGNFNQQKNDVAIANSETAYTATASIDVDQDLNGNETENKIGTVYPVEEAADLLSVNSGFFPWPPHQNDDPQTPVVNNATLNGAVTVSGNAGINIAAGAGNQQVNSLAIAAGCSACPTGN